MTTAAPHPPPLGLAALGVLFNALVWGLSWWPLRRLEALGLHPLWTTALVYALATGLVLLTQRGAWPALCRAPVLAWLALASGLTNAGFNWAVTVGDVVRVVLLFYLMPAWVVVLAWWLLDERPSRASLLRLLLALAGVFIVLKAPDSPWPLPRSGADALAIAGGFSFALTNVLLRKHHRQPAGARALAMFGGGALLGGVLALGGAALGQWPGLPAPDGPWMGLALALGLAFLASNLALQYGAQGLSATTMSLILLTEVLFASLSAVALGAAVLEPRTLWGGSLIVVAALLAARSR